MKRATFIMIIAALLLGSVGLVACGNQDGEMTQEPVETQSANPPSGDIANWGVPMYPRYNSDSEFYVKSDQGQFLNDKPAVLESRFFKTSDKMDSVVAFYKEKMPASGWKEITWGGSGGVGGRYVAQYEKDDGQETAAMAIGDEGDGTAVQIGWTYVK